MNGTPELHPLQPWLPPQATVLMCGTFPPPKARWSMEFYYPNYINDMWRVMGLLFYDDKDHFVDTGKHTFRLDEIKEFLTERGIALSDTGGEVERMRGNASDKYLHITKPFDLVGLLIQLPCCTEIVTTGEKAAGVVAALTESAVPKTGEYEDIEVRMPDCSVRALHHWRMPSTSRAYPLSVDRKAAMYGRVLKPEGESATLL